MSGYSCEPTDGERIADTLKELMNSLERVASDVQMSDEILFMVDHRIFSAIQNIHDTIEMLRHDM